MSATKLRYGKTGSGKKEHTGLHNRVHETLTTFKNFVEHVGLFTQKNLPNAILSRHERSEGSVRDLIGDLSTCKRSWTPYLDSNAHGGTGIGGVGNVDSCKLTCTLDSMCTAIDWDTASELTQCWLHLHQVSDSYINKGTRPGITHHKQTVTCEEIEGKGVNGLGSLAWSGSGRQAVSCSPEQQGVDNQRERPE